MKILLVDNYDSFTFNLYQYLLEESCDVEVRRNDNLEIDVTEYDGVVFSPGPGIPQEAGQLLSFIEQNLDKIPMLGVCLGHQAIGLVCGGELDLLPIVYHAKKSKIKVESAALLFQGLPPQLEVGRYHSWVIQEDSIPEDLEVDARDASGAIMAMHHVKHPVYGLQFHPESILTPDGREMIRNFLRVIKNQVENGIRSTVYKG